MFSFKPLLLLFLFLRDQIHRCLTLLCLLSAAGTNYFKKPFPGNSWYRRQFPKCCEAALRGVKCPLSGWAGSAAWPAPAGSSRLGGGWGIPGMQAGDPLLLPAQPAGSAAGAVLLLILSCDRQLSDLRARPGNVVGQPAGSLQAGTEHWFVRVVSAPWCGASLCPKSDALGLGGCRCGQSVQHLGSQPLRICSCHSSPQLLCWVEGQEGSAVFGDCSATFLYGRAAPGLPWGFSPSDSSRSCGGRNETSASPDSFSSLKEGLLMYWSTWQMVPGS